jgi:hypothetical protein
VGVQALTCDEAVSDAPEKVMVPSDSRVPLRANGTVTLSVAPAGIDVLPRMANKLVPVPDRELDGVNETTPEVVKTAPFKLVELESERVEVTATVPATVTPFPSAVGTLI